jgi:hypothetical protein
MSISDDPGELPAQEPHRAHQFRAQSSQYVPSPSTSSSSHSTPEAISSVSTAIEWLRSTFLFVRIVKNPTFYALNNGSTAPEVRLEEICTNSVQELIESGVVEEEGEKLTSNSEFRVVSLGEGN